MPPIMLGNAKFCLVFAARVNQIAERKKWHVLGKLSWDALSFLKDLRVRMGAMVVIDDVYSIISFNLRWKNKYIT